MYDLTIIIPFFHKHKEFEYSLKKFRTARKSS